jgi:hypothetical protein
VYIRLSSKEEPPGISKQLASATNSGTQILTYNDILRKAANACVRSVVLPPPGDSTILLAKSETKRPGNARDSLDRVSAYLK